MQISCVTGTNGKTSTTYLIASILRAAGHPVLAETTIGYRLEDEPIDVRRTTRGFLGAMQHSASRGAKHAVVEATSQALARGYAKLWRFDLGVFTNLSQDHIAAHGSWEHYLASKAQLFLHLAPGRTAVLNAFDSASELIDRVVPADVHRLWYGVPSRGAPHHPPDLVAERVEVSTEGTTLHLGHTSLQQRLGPDLHMCWASTEPSVVHVQLARWLTRRRGRSRWKSTCATEKRPRP